MRHHPVQVIVSLALFGAGMLAGTPVVAAGKDENATPAAVVEAPRTPAERPLYYERELTEADLEGRTLRELTLMRNWIYARAGNVFRKEWLDEFFSAQPWYQAIGLDMKKLSPVDRRNAELIAAAETGIPRSELLQRRQALVERDDLTTEEEIEGALLSRALGMDSPFYQLWERTPLDDPRQLDQQLTVQQLSDLSRRDLRILRNLIYARHGRPFSSELVREYFERMDWYKADPSYTDARLTRLDHRNIKVIQSVEKELGGPMSDEEQWLDTA